MDSKGFLRRPFTVYAVATILFLVAASFPVQVIVLYGHHLGEWDLVLNKLTVLNWLAIIGCLLTGALVYRGSVLALAAVPSLFTLIAVNNFFVGYLATDFSFLTTSLGTLGFGALLSPLYFGEVRELFLHPERRWWRSKLRRRIPLAILVGTSDSVKISGTTHDISETGAFLPLEAVSQYLDGTVNICLTLSGLQQIQCEATVVRHSAAKGTYPAGVGLQFKNLDWRQRRELKRYLASGARPHI